MDVRIVRSIAEQNPVNDLILLFRSEKDEFQIMIKIKLRFTMITMINLTFREHSTHKYQPGWLGEFKIRQSDNKVAKLIKSGSSSS